MEARNQEFLPPEQYEIMLLAEDIDINSLSGFIGLNANICKIILLHIPDKMRMIFANSMFKWAMSTVKLLPNPGNWRPISTTNLFSKILEKLVHRQVLKYFLDNEVINKNQYGFLPGKSTHEAIFKTVQNIYSAINSKKLLGMMLLDVAKVFNCIDHGILFVKMELAGFSLNVINWFRSYLSRTQRVNLDGAMSGILPVLKGIAQGTVLGPLLFIFYINDIFSIVRNVKMSLFADDCVIFLSGNNWVDVHRKIQSDFDSILEWTYRNSLRLNHSKTKAIIFGSRSKLANISIQRPFIMNGVELGFVKSHSYLGIQLDNIMSLNALVKDIKKKISNKIFVFRKIRKYLNFHASVLVYKQTIMPILDYAGFMLISCRKEDISDFQILQNDILRICNLSRISDRVSIKELHAKCKIISLEQRMRIQLLWLMYLLSRDPAFIRVPNRITRSADKIVFKVLAKILPIYEHSPYYIGTQLWNNLPKIVQDSPNVYAFKKEIRRMNRTYVKL